MLATALIAGCGASVKLPSAPPTTGPPAATDDRPLDAAELDAQRFREGFGLRSDPAWIRQVAVDPSADRTTFGVPLTHDEVAELNRRSMTAEELQQTVLAYALAQPEYAGAWIDHGRAGMFVVQFSGSILEHQLEIMSRVRPGAQIEVRQVRWSWAQLLEFSDRISGSEQWMESIPAYLVGYGPEMVLNRVEIEISSADPAAADKIKAHFGWTDDILIVESDGTGILLEANGTLEVHAVDPAGKPVPGLECVMVSDAKNATESRPLPMPTTDDEGVCSREVAPTGYTIQLETGHAPPTVVAVGRAVVKPRTLTVVTIIVTSRP